MIVVYTLLLISSFESMQLIKTVYLIQSNMFIKISFLIKLIFLFQVRSSRLLLLLLLFVKQLLTLHLIMLIWSLSSIHLINVIFKLYLSANIFILFSNKSNSFSKIYALHKYNNKMFWFFLHLIKYIKLLMILFSLSKHLTRLFLLIVLSNVYLLIRFKNNDTVKIFLIFILVI